MERAVKKCSPLPAPPDELAIERTSRSRYRTLLSNPKKRSRLLDKLNHSPPLDPRYTKWLSTFMKATKSLDVDAETSVILISADDILDGKTMLYEEDTSTE